MSLSKTAWGHIRGASSPEAKFLLGLCLAQTEGDIDAARESYGKTTKIKMNPYGGHPANASMIEVMSDPSDAAYERVMNGFDAVIDYYAKHNMLGGAKTPSEAMRAIVKKLHGSEQLEFDDENEDDDISTAMARNKQISPSVFHIVNAAGRTKTLTIGDVGTGIIGRDFPSTILSLSSNNKISNNLACGRYGIGGCASLNFAKRTVIVSISDKTPGTVFFTLAESVFLPGWKSASYQYCTDQKGGVFSCALSDIPTDAIRIMDDINVRNSQKEEFNVIYLPREHGTVIRLVGYEFSGVVDVYNTLRESGFGITLPLRFINVPGKERSRFHNITGLRYLLSSPKAAARKSHPVIHKMGPIRQPLTIDPEAGHVMVQYWIMDSNTDKKPTESVLTNKERGIFITLNGQTHHRLPTRVLLRKDFPAIDQHIVIEVNCDTLNPTVLGKFFVSNRQDVKKSFSKEIEAIILKVLKADAAVARINEEFSNRVRAHATPQMASTIEEINRLLANPLAGATLANFGGTTMRATTDAADSHIARGTGRRGEGRTGVEPIPERDPPTFLKLRGDTISCDKRGVFLRVRTDASEKHTASCKLITPDGCGVRATGVTLPFRKGHGAFEVTCEYASLAGSVVPIGVEMALPDGRILTDTRDYEIVRTSDRDKIPSRRQPTQPEVVPVFVDPSHDLWQEIEQGGIAADEVAYRFSYNQTVGRLAVMINRDFSTLRQLKTRLIQKYGTAAAAALERRYSIKLAIMSLPYVEQELNDASGISGLDGDTAHLIRAATARGMLTGEAIEIAQQAAGILNEDDAAEEPEKRRPA